MKTSYVRMGVILFPLLLALMVNQVQGECDDTKGKLSFQKMVFAWKNSKTIILYLVFQCITSKTTAMMQAGQDKDRICQLSREMLNCIDDCSDATQFQSALAVSKIFWK